MLKNKKFLINAVILTLTTIVLKGMNMTMNVYVSSKIGSDGIGVFQLLISVYIFAMTLATSGIVLATTRLVAEELAVNSHSGVRKAVKKCLLYATSFGVLASILFYLSADYIAYDWLDSMIEPTSVHLLCLTLPCLSVTSVFSGYFMAVRRITVSSITHIIEQFIRMGLIVVFFSLFTNQSIAQRINYVVLAGIIADVFFFLSNVILYYFDKKVYNKKDTHDPNLTKRMLSIAVPVALSSYLRAALNTLKQVLVPWGLKAFGSSTQIAMGQYGMIRGMVMPVIFFPSALLGAFSSLLIPEIAENAVHKNTAANNKIISSIFKITLIFAICVGGILWAFSQELSLAIYNSEEPAAFIRVFAPMVLISYFDEIVDAILKGLNQQVYVVGVNIADTVISIALIYTLLPVFGIQGYIFIIIASELFNGFASIRRLIKVMDFEINIIAWIIIPSVIMTASIAISKIFFSANLYLCIILSIIIYLCILYISGIISKKDLSFQGLNVSPVNN